MITMSSAILCDGILDNKFFIAILNMIFYGKLAEAWKISYAGTISFFLLIISGIAYLIASYPAFLLGNLEQVLITYFRSTKKKK